MDHQTTSETSTQRGSALIMVVFTLFLVMLVLSAIFVLARKNLLDVSEDHWKEKAQYAGRAGIEHAIAYLSTHPEFARASSTSNAGASLPEARLEDEPTVTYTVQMLNNDTNGELPSPDGQMTVPAGVVWVKSIGKLSDRADAASTSIIRLVGNQRPILKQAFFGMNNLLVNGGSQIFAFDSGAASSIPPVVVANRADIGTNSTLAGAVKVEGTSSRVDGEARAGVGTVLSTVNNVLQVNSGGQITGQRLVSEEATQIPRFIIDSSATTPKIYQHRLVFGSGVTSDGEDPAKKYFHRTSVDTSPLPAGQSPVSYIGPEGYEGVLPSTPGSSDARINDRPVLSRGAYDLNPPADPVTATTPPQEPAGTVRVKNAIFKRGLYYFKGNLILEGHINVDPGPPNSNLEDPCVIYVDGDITIAPGAQINWDGYNNEDFDGDTLKDEPLAPRLLQLYTVMDKDQNFQDATSRHKLICGGTGPRTKASFISVGANVEARIDNSDFFGGIQAYSAEVTGGSKAYFDVDVYGKPLEGRGELSVLISTVSVYATSGVVAAGPPTTVSSTAPAPTYGTYTWSCSPIPPLPASLSYPCY